MRVIDCSLNRILRRRGNTSTEIAIVLAVVLSIIVIAAFTTSRKMETVFQTVAKLHPHMTAEANSDHSKTRTSLTVESLLKLMQDDFHELSLVAGLLMCCCLLAYYAFRKKKRVYGQLSLYDDQVDEGQLTTLPQNLFEKRQKLFRRLTCLVESGDIKEVRVKHMMSLIPSTAKPETPVEEIAEQMKEHRFRHMLVTDDSGNLIGIISDRDIGQREGAFAADIMSERMTVVSPENELIPAVTMMMNRGISALPVVDGRKLLGIVTTTDIMLIMQCLILISHRDDREAPSAVAERGSIPTPVAPVIDSTAGTLTGIAALVQYGKLPSQD